MSAKVLASHLVVASRQLGDWSDLVVQLGQSLAGISVLTELDDLAWLVIKTNPCLPVVLGMPEHSIRSCAVTHVIGGLTVDHGEIQIRGREDLHGSQRQDGTRVCRLTTASNDDYEREQTAVK